MPDSKGGNYYVVLTGSKNNAGDFLIKHRAKKLFEIFRPDREIIDIDAWKKFDQDTLEFVNGAKALILLGGPSLQLNMYPNIYGLVDALEKITVPITTMGVGWKSINGQWEDTYDYPLSGRTVELLKKIDSSGLASSVRDYHTLNMLALKGFNSFLMTGCTAYYDIPFLGTSISLPEKVSKVSFSLGVSFMESPSMEKEMKLQILQLRDAFKVSFFEVVFHHGLNTTEFLQTHGAKKRHNYRHNVFLNWLKEKGVSFVDISGSAENLINYYNGVDLHIGYRVHAHIFMNSVSKPSVLISEDGRGKAVDKVIGGIVINGFNAYKKNIVSKVLNRLFHFYDRYTANTRVTQEVLCQLGYERKTQSARFLLSRKLIDENFRVMKKYISQLP